RVRVTRIGAGRRISRQSTLISGSGAISPRFAIFFACFAWRAALIAAFFALPDNFAFLRWSPMMSPLSVLTGARWVPVRRSERYPQRRPITAFQDESGIYRHFPDLEQGELLGRRPRGRRGRAGGRPGGGAHPVTGRGGADAVPLGGPPHRVGDALLVRPGRVGAPAVQLQVPGDEPRVLPGQPGHEPFTRPRPQVQHDRHDPGGPGLGD